MHNFSLAGFIGHLMHMTAEVHELERDILTEIAESLHEEATGGMGNYKFGFQKLKPATIARKRTGDSPLVETGKLKSSVSYNVSSPLAWVGTDEMTGVWNFMGTSRGIPPRDPVRAAMVQFGDKIMHKAGRDFAAWAGGDGLPKSRIR